MKALTVYQPWASLECLGLKGTETRGRATKYRGPLIIHAGAKWGDLQDRVYVELDAHLQRIGWCRPGGGLGLPPLFLFPLGAALAVAELVDCLRVTTENCTQFSEFDRLAGDLSLGRYVWVLERVRPLREPIPCRGAQGLWTVSPEVEEQVLRQIQISAALDTSHRRRDLAQKGAIE